MADPVVAGPEPADLAPVPGRPIACYLADLAARLRGSARWRRDVLAEAEDGLLCAAATHAAECGDPALAERRAVAEWGDVGRIAAEYNAGADRLTARRLNRHALVLTPLLVVAWGAAVRFGPPGPWGHRPVQVTLGLLTMGGAGAFAWASAALGERAGSGVRALRADSTVVYQRALAAGHGLLLAMATSMAMLAHRGIPHPRSLSWPLVALPALLSMAAILRLTALMRGLRPGFATGRIAWCGRRPRGKKPARALARARSEHDECQHRESRYVECPSRSLSRERPEG